MSKRALTKRLEKIRKLESELSSIKLELKKYKEIYGELPEDIKETMT